MKKSILAAAVALLLCVVGAVPVAAQSSGTHVYPGGSIQAAVDMAAPGGTIVVHKGEYHQSVVISTNGITLKAMNGAVLDGDGPADPGTNLTRIGIWLSSEVTGVTITGFEIRDYVAFQPPYEVPYDLGIAIWLQNGSHENNISRNEISSSTFGIMVSTSGGNLIERNKVLNCWGGIGLEQHSFDNTVVMNNVTGSNMVSGIAADEESHGNLIEKNRVSGADYGIGLTGGSYDNAVIRNTVSDSPIYDLYSYDAGLGNTWEKNRYETSNF